MGALRLLVWYSENGSLPLGSSTPKSISKSNYGKIDDRPKLRDSLQTPRLFDSVKVVKDKERWRCHRLEEVRGT